MNILSLRESPNDIEKAATKKQASRITITEYTKPSGISHFAVKDNTIEGTATLTQGSIAFKTYSRTESFIICLIMNIRATNAEIATIRCTIKTAYGSAPNLNTA